MKTASAFFTARLGHLSLFRRNASTNTTAPGQALLGRYILSMAGMAIIDVCFSGAYVLISGNFAVIWRAAIVNAAILLILNVMGAAIIFRPVYRLINALARGDGRCEAGVLGEREIAGRQLDQLEQVAVGILEEQHREGWVSGEAGDRDLAPEADAACREPIVGICQ